MGSKALLARMRQRGQQQLPHLPAPEPASASLDDGGHRGPAVADDGVMLGSSQGGRLSSGTTSRLPAVAAAAASTGARGGASSSHAPRPPAGATAAASMGADAMMAKLLSFLEASGGEAGSSVLVQHFSHEVGPCVPVHLVTAQSPPLLLPPIANFGFPRL